jgi:hypothetical protein
VIVQRAFTTLDNHKFLEKKPPLIGKRGEKLTWLERVGVCNKSLFFLNLVRRAKKVWSYPDDEV